MSGKIEFKVRKGISKNGRYHYYPEWYLECTDESNFSKVKLSPSYNELSEILKTIIQHEKKVDKTRERKQDATSRAKQLVLSIIDGLGDVQFFEAIYLNQKNEKITINK